MSMQIEFKNEYNETTYYFGTVKEPESSSHGEYDFTVVVSYFSNTGNYTITEIIWTGDGIPEDVYKTEKRISKATEEELLANDTDDGSWKER